MRISFENKTLMDLCNKESLMLSAYGEVCSGFLKRRLIQLSAAECLGIFMPADSPPLYCSSTQHNKNKFKLLLGEEFILLFEAVDINTNTNENTLDWNMIKSIVILKVDRIKS